MSKHIVVIHSGGMDSSLCLALALQEFGPEQVLSLSFNYGQRHHQELLQAEQMCRDLKVDHVTLSLSCLNEIADNALTRHEMTIAHQSGESPNTLVVGRNGLMVRLAAIQAHQLGAHAVSLGVMERVDANSGYRDCSRAYMDLEEKILQIDLDDPSFRIRTPLIDMTKKDTMKEAHRLGILEYLLTHTITCYEGVPLAGCQKCPSCRLRNDGLKAFLRETPSLTTPYEIA